MPDSLFTWDALATLAGAALLTFLIVQYTKTLLDRLIHIPTDLYAVTVGAAVMICATAAQGQELTWAAIALAVANGFLVAAAAGQMHNKALNPPKATTALERREGV